MRLFNFNQPALLWEKTGRCQSALRSIGNSTWFQFSTSHKLVILTTLGHSSFTAQDQLRSSNPERSWTCTMYIIQTTRQHSRLLRSHYPRKVSSNMLGTPSWKRTCITSFRFLVCLVMANAWKSTNGAVNSSLSYK